MALPNPGLLERKEAIAQLQREIEVRSGLMLKDVHAELAVMLDMTVDSLKRQWLRWRQGRPESPTPSFEQLRNIIQASRTKGWLPPEEDTHSSLGALLGATGLGEGPGNTQGLESSALELLKFVDAEFHRRRGIKIDPVVQQFVRTVFDVLSTFDSQAKMARAAARQTSKTAKKTGILESRKYVSGKLVAAASAASKSGAQATTIPPTFATSLPAVMGALSQEIADFIRINWDDPMSRPSGLDPNSLAVIGAAIARPFETLAVEALAEQKDWERQVAELDAVTTEEEASTGTLKYLENKVDGNSKKPR